MATKIKTTTTSRRMSYRAAADLLGVDVGHLWRVAHGVRDSKRLRRELARRHISLPCDQERPAKVGVA